MSNLIVKNPVNTQLTVDPETGIVKYIYHGTAVVTYYPRNRAVILNTGGYFTNTTKHRMNQFSIEQNLDYSVYQKNKKWFVDVAGGKTLEFLGDTVTFKLPEVK